MDERDAIDFKVAISDQHPEVIYRALRGMVQPVITWRFMEDRDARVFHPITEFPLGSTSYVKKVIAPNHLPIHPGDEVIGIVPLFRAYYESRGMNLSVHDRNSRPKQEHVEGILMCRNGILYGESFRFLPRGTGEFAGLLRGTKPYVEKDELVRLALGCFGRL